jgi:hypothetical protein
MQMGYEFGIAVKNVIEKQIKEWIFVEISGMHIFLVVLPVLFIPGQNFG